MGFQGMNCIFEGALKRSLKGGFKRASRRLQGMTFVFLSGKFCLRTEELEGASKGL